MPKFYELSEEYSNYLKDARSAIFPVLSDEFKKGIDDSLGKLKIANDIYQSGDWQSNSSLNEILTVFFADAINLKIGTEWATVEDEYGTDLVIKMPGYEIYISPFSVIEKKIGTEELDLFYMYEWLCNKLTEMRDSGEYKKS
jgi:hypothetical protein